MFSTRLSNDSKPRVLIVVLCTSISLSMRPTVCVMNCVLAACWSWSSHESSTMLQPSVRKICNHLFNDEQHCAQAQLAFFQARSCHPHAALSWTACQCEHVCTGTALAWLPHGKQ